MKIIFDKHLNLRNVGEDLSSFLSSSFSYLRLIAPRAQPGAGASQDPAHENAVVCASPAQITFCEVLCARLTSFLASLRSAVCDAEQRNDDVDQLAGIVQFYFTLHETTLDQICSTENFRQKYPLPFLFSSHFPSPLSLFFFPFSPFPFPFPPSPYPLSPSPLFSFPLPLPSFLFKVI